MKNIAKIVSMSLLLFFIGVAATSCDSNETVVVPENWITVETTPMTIGYEGGRLVLDYKLAADLSESALYIINNESWCSGYIKDGKILVDVTLSDAADGRSAKMSLIYDENHKVELTVEQGNAPLIEVESIDVTQVPTSIAAGKSLNLAEYITISPADASYKNLIYTVVKGGEFISVTETGVVKGLVGGKATIEATARDEGGAIATIEIEVVTLFNREGWTVTTSAKYEDGRNYFPDGNDANGKPEYLLDDKINTFFVLVKSTSASMTSSPGGTKYTYYGSDSGDMSFTVDMKETKTFNYFIWHHSATATTNPGPKVAEVEIYGSSNNKDFTLIKSGCAIPVDYLVPHQIDVPESTYRYVKVKFTNWSTTSHNSVQVAEFNLGFK